MAESRKVSLLNGAAKDELDVALAMVKLRQLLRVSPQAFIEMIRICKYGIAVSSASLSAMRGVELLEGTNTIPAIVKDVVMSMCQDDWLEHRLAQQLISGSTINVVLPNPVKVDGDLSD